MPVETLRGLVKNRLAFSAVVAYWVLSSQRERKIMIMWEGFPHLTDSTFLEKGKIILLIRNALFLPFI